MLSPQPCYWYISVGHTHFHYSLSLTPEKDPEKCMAYLPSLKNVLCTQNMFTSLNTHGLFHLFCRCDNGHISAYLGGQDINEDAADEIFCGSTLPNALTTRNPRLLLILDTHGRVPGKGFKADYNFVTGMSSHLTVQSSMMWAVFIILSKSM